MATVNLMAIPDFQTMMRPVLVAIEGDEPQSTAQIRDMIATVRWSIPGLMHTSFCVTGVSDLTVSVVPECTKAVSCP